MLLLSFTYVDSLDCFSTLQAGYNCFVLLNYSIYWLAHMKWLGILHYSSPLGNEQWVFADMAVNSPRGKVQPPLLLGRELSSVLPSYNPPYTQFSSLRFYTFSYHCFSFLSLELLYSAISIILALSRM